MRVLTIAVLLCTALALPAATDSVNSLRKKKHVGCVNCHHWGLCPAGWSTFGSRCFLFVRLRKPWTQAELHCNRQGGHLASLHSFQEFQFVRSLTHQGAWIGGTDSYTEGHWQWSDGSGFYYTQWNSGEPNNALGKEHCLCINYKGTSGWNDYFCTHRYPFICAL
ncbi:hypothetical protein MATL_G00000040 [Megalops atlanticus]|uniref:C-type lectin domain-containing protein n=1 Tax=Megalops atlanticus TaxID=7932 RepID=A0A9D3TDL3_MEGAT|nr:hypothetical protein MATL_G00000040 [Megalops atlanticus]